MKSLKFDVLLVLLIVVGLFLRLYKIEENLVFHGELGSNYLAIKDFLLTGQFPLLGPETSHPWLSFGPAYYWLISPFFALFDFDPKIGAYVFAVLGALVIYINYYFVKKIINPKVALISSLLITFSPLYLDYAREARFFSIVLLLFYPFYYFFSKLFTDKKEYFWFGFFYGLFFSFHYSPLMYLPIILVVFWRMRKSIKLEDISKTLLGFVLPNLTILLSDLLGKSSIVPNLGLWVPYRILGFLNVYPKNNLTEEIAKINLNGIVAFFNSVLVPSLMHFPMLGVFVFLAITFIVFIKRKVIPQSVQILYYFLLSGLLVLFVHGDFPQHYFLPLIPVCIILFSLFLEKLYVKNKALTILITCLFVIVNLKYLFSENWFYKYQNLNNIQVSYETQKLVSKAIVNDARGRPFSLKRIGTGDEFELNFAQNYIYLMWYYGNQPVINSKLIYTIYEKEEKVNPYIKINNINVTKNE